MMAKENEITFLKCNFLALRKGFENIGKEINLIKDENVKLRKELEKKIEYLATQKLIYYKINQWDQQHAKIKRKKLYT